MGVSSDGRTVETEILDDGLTASDPAFALERLTFNPNGLSTLRLDLDQPPLKWSRWNVSSR
jgi:hypothetical protein